MQLLSLLHQTSCYTCFGEYWSQYNKCISKYIKHHSNILFKTFICLTLQFWVNIMIREWKITLIFFVLFSFSFCNVIMNLVTEMAWMDYNTFFMRVTFLASMSTSKIFIPHYLSGICLCVLSLRSNKCCAALCRSLKWVSEVSLKQHTRSDPTHWRGGKKHKHCTGTIAWEMQARGTPKTQRKGKKKW